MGRVGPCFHCGIKYTPLWRSGPPTKPVLCNACGSMWRIKGSLKDYRPKHIITGKIAPRRKRGNPLKLRNITKPKVVAEVARPGPYSASLEDDARNRSWSGSSRNCNKMESINGSDQSTVSNSHVPRRKRSAPKQIILSPIQRFQWKLYCLSQKPEFSKLREEEEDVLIYHHNSSQMPSSTSEIGLGAILLKPPTSPDN